MAFDDPSTWPNHLISLRKRLIGEENDEMERKTRDRDVCKVLKIILIILIVMVIIIIINILLQKNVPSQLFPNTN